MRYFFSCLLAVFVFSGCNESAQKTNPEEAKSTRQMDGADADFKGLTETEAVALAEKRELKHRVVERDGQPLPATRDLRPDRVSFTVKEGRVIAVSRG